MEVKIMPAWILAGILVLPALTRNAAAMAPNYLTDREMAGFPVIVVAQWNPADFQRHNQHRREADGRDIAVKIEAFTDVEVLRVIKGPVKPGIHRLKIGYGIAWTTNYLFSGTSTELPGDVDIVTNPAIWFLKLEKSWDTADQTDYLSIDNYRAIQPLALGPYYKALSSGEMDARLTGFLQSDQALVVNRALKYACGEILPWPYDDDLMGTKPEMRGRVWPEAADAVLGIVAKETQRDVHALAVAAYAELKGKDAVPVGSGLLTNRNPDVRSMALAVLAHAGDARATDEMGRVASEMTNGWVACKAIEYLHWNRDLRFVPVLIRFLQNDHFCGLAAVNSVPALKAHQALYVLTGVEFPYDVEASLSAWGKVSGLTNEDERAERLAQLIPYNPAPLELQAAGSSGAPALRIRNVSTQTVVITRSPAAVFEEYPGGTSISELDTGADPAEAAFVTLKPGDDAPCVDDPGEAYRKADPFARRLTVVYARNGNAIGLHAWIGLVRTKPGTRLPGEAVPEDERKENGP